MSGLETLPPDQRAVLQLILAQGRGYAELAQLLKIDAGAVRTRAHAGLDALAGGGSAPDADSRAQIADYLLGQQDDGERLVTLVALGESDAACRWAQALRAQLLPLARIPLPEVPEAVATNGAAATPPPVAAAAPPPPPAQPAPPAATPHPPAPQPPSPATAPVAAPQPSDSPPASPAAPRPSRLGGAILLAAAAAVAIVLAIVLIGGDGDDGTSGTPAAATGTTAQTTPQQASTTGSQTGQIIAQVNLLATPAGGQAAGLGFVQRASGKLAIAIQAEKLPANGAQDIYAAWLSGSSGTKLLGFVQRQVKANGSFAVSAALPADVRRYDTILISRESIAEGTTPTQPGETILRGGLTLP